MTGKTVKPKPGTVAELSAMYPAPRRIPVRVVRIEGDKGERKVVTEHSIAVVCKLPIDVLNRMVQILEPVIERGGDAPVRVTKMMLDHEGEFHAFIAEATGWPAADVARFMGEDYMAVINAILEDNSDFFLHRLGLVGFASPAIRSASGDGPRPSPSSGAGDAPIPSVTHSPSLTPQ